MSTALGIASVTHVLKDLLNNGLIDQDVTGIVNGNVRVTALPPDRIDTSATNEPSGLNLFMYQARPNPGWRNEGLPSYDASGRRVNNPPLALDLHYFLTAYGAEELHAEILLGYGMQLFHENPTLPREAIRRSLAAPSTVAAGGVPPVLPPALRALSTSELAEQVEQIKITPESLSADEISRLWTAFQAKYRLTAAYKVTVVLIQSQKSTRPALPVQRRLIYALPFRQPVIEVLKSQAPTAGAPILENQKILAGHKLIIAGHQLSDDVVTVSIDGEPITPDLVTDSELVVTLPGTVSSGLHGLQVVHQRLMGDPEIGHRGGASNLESFVLSPTISMVGYANTSGAGANPRSGNLTIGVVPAITAPQRVLVLLNELVTTNAHAYSFPMPTAVPTAPPASSISVPINGVATGTYLVRIQVDGAESPLTTNPAGAFSQPAILIA